MTVETIQASHDQGENHNEKANYPLCLKCRQLELAPQRFIVRSLDPELTEPVNFRLRSTSIPSYFGTLKEIMESSQSCNLCNLVFKSVQPEKNNGQPEAAETSRNHESASCFLNWEVDGREIFETQDRGRGQGEVHQSARGLTRRLHLRWNHAGLQDSYLVYAASEALHTASDADKVWNPSRLFLGRQIGHQRTVQARVKSWIDLCQHKHRGPCFTPQGYMRTRFRKMLSHAYFGVIDVLNMQLTELPIDQSRVAYNPIPEYAALSYVWGTTPSYTTILANVMQHRLHGGLDRVFHDLPKVIQDSIDLVRRIGLQYLWIDALCIVQDSERSWNLNAYNMDLIYGNAAFTICAADGSDASTGLLAMNANTGFRSRDQHIADCADDVRVIVSRPPEMYIRSSRWNTRAWTFQERLLSRRCLIFTGNRVFFQCRSTGMSEDIYADREGAGWSLDFVDAPLQTFRQLSSRSLWVYFKSVELYTARELSKPGDILAAFSGVSNLMQRTMQAPFVFGLPTSHFDAALLWAYSKPVLRRISRQDMKGETHDFPSWSWSGWLGAPTQYRREMIKDCLDNVREWLKDRTWIRWYIRDSNGDLRPLWDPDDWSIDLSEHEKWQGYGQQRSGGSMRLRRASLGQGDYAGRAHDPADPSPPSPPPADVEYHRENLSSPEWTLEADSDNDDQLYATSRSRKRRSRDTATKGKPKGRRITRTVSDLSEVDDSSSNSLTNSNTDTRSRRKERKNTRSRSTPHPGTDLAKRASDVEQEKASKLTSSTNTWNPKPYLIIIEDWCRASYYNELVRFFVDVLLAMFRLVKHLLGVPTEFVPSHSTQLRDMVEMSESSVCLEGNVSTETPLNVKASTASDGGSYKRRRPSRHDRNGSTQPPKTPTSGREQRPRKTIYVHEHSDDSDSTEAASPHEHEPRYVRFTPPRPHKSPVTNPFSVGYNRDPYPPDNPRYFHRPQVPNVPTPVIRLNPTENTVSAAQRRHHDLVFQPDSRVTPEDTERSPAFRIALKEFPYQPTITQFSSGEETKATFLPILQFWTWHTTLFIQHNAPSSSQNPDHPVRCNIADRFGDWCGAITLDAAWVRGAKTAKQEFVAISEAKKFTDDECALWSYYIPKERDESEWDLFYVLLIAWSDGRWERVGLGKVFKEAFREAEWKEIVLA